MVDEKLVNFLLVLVTGVVWKADIADSSRSKVSFNMWGCEPALEWLCLFLRREELTLHKAAL